MSRPAGAGGRTAFGFDWGPIDVERMTIVRGTHVLKVNDLNIYVSPTGRSVRVFRKGKELK